MDQPCGSLWITTLAKLPITAPRAKAKIVIWNWIVIVRSFIN